MSYEGIDLASLRDLLVQRGILEPYPDVYAFTVGFMNRLVARASYLQKLDSRLQRRALSQMACIDLIQELKDISEKERVSIEVLLHIIIDQQYAVDELK